MIRWLHAFSLSFRAFAIGKFVLISTTLALPLAALAETPEQSYKRLKKTYECEASNTLVCIDACTGNVLAKNNGPSATFLGVELRAVIRVRVVGFCTDVGAQFSSSVSYRASSNSLTKTSPPPAVAANPAALAAVPTLNQLADFQVTLAGTGNDDVAELTVAREPLTPGAALPVPAAVSAAPVVGKPWKSVRVTYILSHGRYYLDFGVGLAVVPKGKHSVAAVPYRGDETDLRLATESSTPLTPLFTAFVYPFGHARRTFTPFSKTEWYRSGPVLQVATELSRANLFRTVYLGAGYEVVSGLNITAGTALVPVTVYRSGAQPGMLIPDSVDLSGLTREVNVVRFYFAISATTEVFNAAKSAYALVANN